MSDRSHNPSPARQVQWPRFVIEGVVIVASILLAFGIEAWWEGRQEREREREYVGALRQDFDQNLRLIDEAIADQESGVEMIVLLREQLSGSSPSVQRDSLNHHFALAFGVTTHQAVPTTYDELVSTGELGLLTNADLRTALGSWSTQLQYTRRIEADALAFRDGVAWFYLVDHTAVGEYAPTLSGIWPEGISFGSPFATDWEAIAEDRRIDNLLAARILYIGAVMAEHRSLRDLIRRIRTELQESPSTAP